MASPKKIFFSYSSQPEDLTLYNKLYKHFALYSKAGYIGIIGKDELLSIDNDTTRINEILKSVDITVPLLSTNFFNDSNCLQQISAASSQQVKIIPILLSSCEWQIFPGYIQYESNLLPEDKQPLLAHMDDTSDKDKVLMEVAQRIKHIAFPEIKELQLAKPNNLFNYILAVIVMALGVAAAIYVFRETQNNTFTILSFLMFACIAMVSLKNVLFPSKTSLK